MVGIVLIAHEPLASALASSGVHVYACAPDVAEAQLAVLDVPPDVDVQALRVQAQSLVTQVNRGRGVLILTDVIGATPCNVASQLIAHDHVAVVAGVNLPMLLRVLCYRRGTLAEVVQKALDGGAHGVVQVTPGA